MASVTPMFLRFPEVPLGNLFFRRLISVRFLNLILKGIGLSHENSPEEKEKGCHKMTKAICNSPFFHVIISAR